jgi:IS4 transposase
VPHVDAGAQHAYAYVVPIIKYAINKELSEGWSRETGHDLTTEFADHGWTVEFPVMIDYPSRMCRDDEHGVGRQRRSRDAPFIDTPQQARQHYSKRFGVEATYQLSESSLIPTTATDQTRRLLFVVVSLLLWQNVWRYLHWEYAATLRRGRCRLWW